MEKQTKRFLNVSIALVSLFCIFIFIIQMLWSNIVGENTIRDLGVFYISGLSEQVGAHFGTVIELRLSQIQSLVNAVPPGRVTDETNMLVDLTYNARSVGFEYLTFYTNDDKFHMIYGSQVRPDVPEALRQSVLSGKCNVCAGKDKFGTPVVLLGVPANYPMADGSTSVALVAGLPISYVGVTLAGKLESNIEYAIIRDDGSYVLSNPSIQTKNYFDRVEQLYETCNGKEPIEYEKELRAAMEADESYTSEAIISGERWNIYCTNLPNSEWHLLLKVSHNTMDESVHLLQKKWSYIFTGGCCLIICALLFVFIGYYRLARIHMRALDEARETAEHAQQMAERSNQAKSEFLSNMSHDIRTPMNGIMGMTALAIDHLGDPSRVLSCLKKINVSSRHLLGIIADLLDMSKIENGNLTLNIEPLSLREVIQNIAIIIQPQVQEKNIQFHIYTHDIYHENICTDRVRLSQILLNIIGNAVKFTQEGGRIEVNLYEETSSKGDKYSRYILYVKDNGIGMSKEFQSNIFKAFAREDHSRVSNTAGAGMGMTITKHIIDAMGGTITIESELGMGSCFCVSVDLEVTGNSEKELRLPERNILMVDDDKMDGNLAVTTLESLGLHAETISDCEQAVQVIEERCDKDKPYHIILLDENLWKHDITQTTKEAFDRLGLPIILLVTGEWNEHEPETVGVNGFITKPLFLSGLYYGLRPFIEPKATQQEQKQETNVNLEGKRILIAEDNELNWEIASTMLGEFGVETEWAENGQICVEKLEQSSPEWYDAILMDLRMPVMTGFEATKVIRNLERKDARNIPIIAVSADTFAEDIQRCLDHGMNSHLAKPLDLQKLLSLLSQYLY